LGQERSWLLGKVSGSRPDPRPSGQLQQEGRNTHPQEPKPAQGLLPGQHLAHHFERPGWRVRRRTSRPGVVCEGTSFRRPDRSGVASDWRGRRGLEGVGGFWGLGGTNSQTRLWTAAQLKIQGRFPEREFKAAWARNMVTGGGVARNKPPLGRRPEERPARGGVVFGQAPRARSGLEPPSPPPRQSRRTAG